MNFVVEPAKNIPVIDEADICVLGGSCTGVFAAVRAARLGARVVIVEKQNCFGGMATLGMVNIWHSLKDVNYEKQIIAGLTQEIIERLEKRNAVVREEKNHSAGFVLNTDELKIELDELIREAKVKPYLHTFFCAPYIQDGKLKGIFVENKSGRGAILARYFIDATGDGDLCFRLGMKVTTSQHPQPPTMCARYYGWSRYSNRDLQKLIFEHREEYRLREDWGWSIFYPGMPEISLHAETHVFDVDCADASQLTFAEMEGRRQVRAVMDIARKYGTGDIYPALSALPSSIGIRETRHVKAKYKLTQEDVLYGKAFDDAIGYGSYRVDIHSDDRPGILFRYLDGTEVYCRTGYPPETGRWRKDNGPTPSYYQIPYRVILPDDRRFDNVLMCGRMLDADEAAFGAVRVMVNLNQTGEAAGVAAYLALKNASGVDAVNPAELRESLKAGGSVII